MFSLKTKKFAYSFIFVFIVTNVLWNMIFHHKQAFLDWGGICFQIIACLTSVSWLMNTFFKHKGRAKSFWLMLGLGILSYLIGTLIWTFYEFVLNDKGEAHTLPGIFWICQNGFYFIALLVLMNEIRSHLLTIRFFLDMLIVMSVATTFNWIFIMNPLINHKSMLEFNLTEIMYPILDLGVLVGVLCFYAAQNRMFNKPTSYLLISGFLIQIIADSIFSYLKVMKIYSVGSVNEPLWILSILLIGLSGIYHVPTVAKETPVKRPEKGMLIRHSIPYLSVLFLSIYVISSLYKTHPIVVGLFFCILLVILRQLFTLLENDKLVYDLNQLNEDLELKVKERTDKLVETVNSMEHLAYHDVVTGLPNRRFMEKRVSLAIDNKTGKRKIAFMLLDLDRFKHINDSLGHSYGDLLLKEVGKRLVECLKPNEVVCRFGGDEYALLIENTSIQGIERKALRILTALRETFTIEGFELHITPSIGISLFPDHGHDFEALLMKADTAMYKVKEKGKNHYMIYSGSMSMEPMMELESSIRKGIERNEFLLYYQPQISLNTNEIVGVEALLRWDKPSYGMVPPAKFIPLCEDTGLIVPLGEKVLLEACKQSVAWREKGITDLRIAVNISSLQFQDNDFIESVARIIKETRVNPNDIELEITESIAMGSIEKTLAKLSFLKQMGFQIAMDDFGTGYSSLHYLSQFPIDRLKIDRSFISSLEKSEKDAAIVRLIVMMAKGLNFQVLAEGVEEESQKAFLDDIRCDEFQGYLFSRPLSVEECEQLILHQKQGADPCIVHA
ncbi:EAL domain-containing protein [Bacillus sp. sid0103]|uniref:putative bifunctional diguanylate cyclase/phosphodiesterase n=1 Tax=Bacillus sp. sid0103 TaxID=2856337 RepID=UPI001C44F489|nr:EAL domain-containing protein [Bacillus sp. sid0103]MBV7504308.1 EAL domain-containing protein [Bacillus sp. sid0103]